MGKTILASTISYNLAKQDVRHLFIAGEMSSVEVHQRLLAREMGCYGSMFRTKAKDPIFQERVRYAAKQISDNLLYQSAPHLTFDGMKALVCEAVHAGAKGFILDYWQLVGGKDSRTSTAEHLEHVAQWIADYCRKEKIWAVVFAQLNQDDNTRGSEGIRLAFDQMYKINREPEGRSGMWLEMMETRYTPWQDVGGENSPAFWLEEHGPYFRESAT
jgi:replicative DNA helicase